MAVAVAVAGSCSSYWTPGLGTSIGREFGPKKTSPLQKKKREKKKRKGKERKEKKNKSSQRATEGGLVAQTKECFLRQGRRVVTPPHRQRPPKKDSEWLFLFCRPSVADV